MARWIDSTSYRCEAASVAGFVQQLKNLVTKGYWWYVTGEVPKEKEHDLKRIDAYIVDKYDLAIPPWTRSRRKLKSGLSNVAFLRFGRRWVILATKGEHRFWNSIHEKRHLAGESFRNEHGQEIRIVDVRQRSIKFFDYQIRYAEGGYLRLTDEQRARGEKARRDPNWHFRVSLRKQAYKDLKAHMLELATKRQPEELEKIIRKRRFLGYAPVQVELERVVRATNKKRRKAGLVSELSLACIPPRIRGVHVFVPPNDGSNPSDRSESNNPNPVAA